MAGVNARSGDELPGVPKFSATLSGDYDFQIGGGIGAFVGGSYHFQGDRKSGFVAGSPASFRRYELPSYNTLDLRAGVNRGDIELAVYVKNVGDAHGLNQVASLTADGYSSPLGASVIQPRTFGVSLSGKF